MDGVKEMAELSGSDVSVASSQLKFFLALKELEKQDLLDDFFAQMNMKSSVDELGADAAIERMVLNFSTAGMKNIINNHPEVLEDINKKIDGQSLEEEFSVAGVNVESVHPDTVEFLKATKVFEAEFPDKESPSLKERMLAGKDNVLKALASDKGKVALNAALLGIAVGTGGAGVIAAAKLAHSVGNMALKNPSVRDLCGRVEEKALGYLANIGIPVDTIRKSMRMVQEKVEAEVEKRPWLKGKMVPILGVAAALGGLLIYQNLDAVSDLASKMTLDNAQSLAASGVNTVLEAGQNIDPGQTVEALKGYSDNVANYFSDQEVPSSAVGFEPEVDAGISIPDPSASIAENLPSSSVGFAPEVDSNISIPDPSGSISDNMVPPVEIDPNGISLPSAEVDTQGIAVPQETPNQVLSKGDIPLSEKEAYAALDQAQAAEHAVHAVGSANVHVVVEKDNLWNITKGLLPEGSSKTMIAEGVQAFIDANPGLETHPNLIYPGDKFLIPESLLAHAEPVPIPIPDVPVPVDAAVMALADVPLNAPTLAPVFPELDTSALEQTTLLPNAAAVLPAVSPGVTDEIKQVAKRVVSPPGISI